MTRSSWIWVCSFLFGIIALSVLSFAVEAGEPIHAQQNVSIRAWCSKAADGITLSEAYASSAKAGSFQWTAFRKSGSCFYSARSIQGRTIEQLGSYTQPTGVVLNLWSVDVRGRTLYAIFSQG